MVLDAASRSLSALNIRVTFTVSTKVMIKGNKTAKTSDRKAGGSFCFSRPRGNSHGRSVDI